MTGLVVGLGRLLRWRDAHGMAAVGRQSPERDLPLRAELLSADQMEQRGGALATAHRIAPGRHRDRLLTRLASNESTLVGVYDTLTAAVAQKRRITPAAEWLLDNFYLIEEQIRTTKRHLPSGYSRELPRLADEVSAGRPRVYDIALEIVSHGDGRVDIEGLGRFVAAYQKVTPLKLGELWATPIMLRLAVIENLRRIGVRIASGWNERCLADAWADEMIATAAKDPKSLILVIADMARSSPPIASAFVAELARRLQGRGPALALPLTWIEQRLTENGLTIEQLVQSENQQQAANQVTVSNSIGSLRVLGAIDWHVFVESMSLVDRTLREDPEGIYAGMDFATRDRYRHATEEIAKWAGAAEVDVARRAVELARACAGNGSEYAHAARARHVGFYLIDGGRARLERDMGVRLPWMRRAGGLAKRMPLTLYLGGIAAIAVAIASAIMAGTAGRVLPWWSAVGLAGLAALAASQTAVSLVNWVTTLLVSPRVLPRMDFSHGIPERWRTLVVVPTMLTSLRNIEQLIEALEVRFLANRDENLHFALLTDVRDAAEQVVAEDGALVAAVGARIDELNQRYSTPSGLEGGDIFFLFHRPRVWNAQERIWMGYERKRGKLSALNKFLRGVSVGQNGESFSVVRGDTAALSAVKYVITLDTDTQLPRDAARQFVGAMAHPLNHPAYDAAKMRVTSGYGVLQPRVAATLTGMNRSRYGRMFGGEAGIDPYTRAISDVYQDVFGEGSFIGKGIYDVDIFESSVDGRLPERRVLSHDLLEGCYARSGLLSDVQLYEDYPARYGTDMERRYRWMRGDWQLVGWLMRRVPRGAGSRTPRRPWNPLSALSQWKLIDNLRRSLVPAALTGLTIAGWMLFPPAWHWTGGVWAILLMPSLCVTLVSAWRIPREVPPRQHWVATARMASRQLVQVSFELSVMPHEALLGLDAALRTCWRMWVSGRRLLEWNTSGDVERGAATNGEGTLAAHVRRMWAGPFIAIVLVVFFLVSDRRGTAVAALPVLLLWISGPVFAWWLSRALEPPKADLTADQVKFLRSVARRTWGYFERFVGDADHWLPPDNYQESRTVPVAHRTSPTNIGIALLANLSAHDFGFITTGRLLERTTNTLRTLGELERYRGHFYNWYDTRSLKPLPPLYVSTVDSGNLAGHLLTLRAGLVSLADDAIWRHAPVDGLIEVVDLLARCGGDTEAARLAECRDILATLVTTAPATLRGRRAGLERLAKCATSLVSTIADRLDGAEASAERRELLRWAQALKQGAADARDELAFMTPWLDGPLPPAGLEECSDFPANPSLRELARLDATLASRIDDRLDAADGDEQVGWLTVFRGHVAEASGRARARIAAFEAAAMSAGDLADMRYDFLYDETRHLLTIGYDVSERRVDSGYYDLLASEARLTTFVAIAQGQIPQESWFALGRQLSGHAGAPVLLSWSGSMFEYLMPLLVMPTANNTLLDASCKAAVARQIEYGDERGVPWGVSESCYNTVDVDLNYQYRAFGTPGLGLKRGLAEDLVVAPYASALTLMVYPEEACRNLERLAARGFLGAYGFYESIDYTPSRQRPGQTHAIVRTFMAHHQGMSLVALSNVLLNRVMQRRFESEPLFRAILLLLQERIPRRAASLWRAAERAVGRTSMAVVDTQIRVYPDVDTPLPEVQLLSNGRYHVMVTHAGGGYSRWKDIAVTRWREDGTGDQWGAFCYLREIAGGSPWSSGFQPTRTVAEKYEAIFSEGRAEFRRRDACSNGEGHFETHTEIVVSPEDDIELRRVRVTNRSRQRREIEVTSYAEVVIALSAADALHPAFSNLFVQTEILKDRRAILCTRRPRSVGDQTPWMLHLMAAHGTESVSVSYETDRARFIGRNRSAADPAAMSGSAPLSDTDGSVLDPIVSIRNRLMLEPDQSVTVDIVSGIADTREAARALIDKYQDRHLADRVFDLTWTHGQVVLRQINASQADSQLHARLASPIIFASARLRADAGVLIQNRRGQSGLWGYAISGDLPIVLLRIGDAANIDLVRQLVQAHSYWRLKGLTVDLVIWNEDHAGYRQQLHEQIMSLIAAGVEASLIDKPGGIFVRAGEQISNEDRILLQSVARAVISDGRGTLAEQLTRCDIVDPPMPALVRARVHRPATEEAVSLGERDLILTNGLGGFTADGREYVLVLPPGAVTPAPWVNVLANPEFGTIVSESGSAYSWFENAHEFRLTPWHNDPVTDSSGEAIYLRDEETGYVWSPTPWAARAQTSYVVRHGFGYSVFEARSGGICSELWVYVAMDAAVKYSVLKLRNVSGRRRKLTATAYVEWVLGDLRSKTAMHIGTESDASSGALLARNPYQTEFPERVAFLDVDDRTRKVTGDRAEFLGRHGDARDPDALRRSALSGKVGVALDPCGAVQVKVDLADGQEQEVVFRLGVGRGYDDAIALVMRSRGSAAARRALEGVWAHWTHTLGAVQVETPDASVNVLANGWLVYQTLACRLWARSGYYQSGGAFGFRDQLQDSMALVHARPALVRAHLLLCANRQFVEGDVQHWWHPPVGRGVRTRCSDDFLWLPLAVCRYVTSTADVGVLEESVYFLEGRQVNPEDDSYYDMPGRSGEAVSVYRHCVAAIRHALRFGVHGLPLMGSGDWNDGMNLVGAGEKGESVWLGFFLCEVLGRFAELASTYGDAATAQMCLDQRQTLRGNIEQHGWDGAWYRRAYFDDGTPLGSSGNAECRIDSISQSWAVLSGAADLARARQGMLAVEERLVRRSEGLVQLLDPPFDRSALNPGYIRGYVPGVRENGGQYTHGAIWAAMAFARLGDAARAWDVLSIINPVQHGLSAEAAAVYKIEPYVVAADVYAVAPHVGRGGWSWYTGSAGWMYRLILESLLGVTVEGARLHLSPCLPAHWGAITVHYRYRDTLHRIVISQRPKMIDQDGGPALWIVDGVERSPGPIELFDDRREHVIEVTVFA